MHTTCTISLLALITLLSACTGSKHLQAAPEDNPQPAPQTQSFSDVDVYRMGLRTTNPEVVSACLSALAKTGDGYADVIGYLEEDFTTRTGLHAAKLLNGFSARPGYLSDMEALFAKINPRKAGVNDQLAIVYQVRFLLLSQLLPSAPETYGKIYLAELPHQIKASRYRLGFNDTVTSDTLRQLSDREILTKADKLALTPHFIRCLDEGFHSSEQQEAMRCLQILTDISPISYSRADKPKAIETYRQWLTDQRQSLKASP